MEKELGFFRVFVTLAVCVQFLKTTLIFKRIDGLLKIQNTLEPQHDDQRNHSRNMKGAKRKIIP
jgi:hypothetical protein